MSIEKPEPGKAIYHEGLLGSEIILPVKREWYKILFFTAWLGGWFFGEKSAIDSLLKSDKNIGESGFMIFWLLGWTLGGCFALFSILKMLYGNDRIVLAHSTLILKKELLGFGLKKEFNLQHILNLRISPNKSGSNWSQNVFSLGFKEGVIAFDYGANTYRIGSSIDEAEGQQIINKLKSRYNFRNTN
jgi:hypothetical protein